MVRLIRKNKEWTSNIRNVKEHIAIDYTHIKMIRVIVNNLFEHFDEINTIKIVQLTKTDYKKK